MTIKGGIFANPLELEINGVGYTASIKAKGEEGSSRSPAHSRS
jgi:hypothetical protein